MSDQKKPQDLRDGELDGAQGGLSLSPTTIDPGADQINTQQSGVTLEPTTTALNTHQSGRTLKLNTQQSG